MESVVTLDSLLKKVLSGANKEQNGMYPPHVFTQHMQIVTQFIVTEAVKLYPGNSSIKNIIRPFVVTSRLPVINGEVKFEDNYRDMLGIKSRVTPDYKNDCGCKEEETFDDDPLAETPDQLRRKQAAAKCISHDVEILEIEEYSGRTTHKYKKPTLRNPIACVFKGDKIQVCPVDISFVDVTYVRNPKEYVYGYKEQPDYTYVFDKNTSTESEWYQPALPYLLKGLNTLFAGYVKDPEMQNWNELIKKGGLF